MYQLRSLLYKYKIMKTLKHENIEELKQKVLDLLAQTSVELGHRMDAKTLAGLSNIFANDLIIEKRFGTLTFSQIKDAFRQGVRFGDFEPFMNIRTFYRWIIKHKKIVNDAIYQTETLGQKNVEFYQKPTKLLR